MIGIIGAMEEEVAAIKEYMEITETRSILDCTFYQGTIKERQVVLLLGGVGKVNAAICTTLLLTNYKIDYVINIGSAGGLCLTQEVGDIVISNEVCQHDFDITAFPNRVIGEVPGLPPRIEADRQLITQAKTILSNYALFFVIIFNLDIGPMYKAEKRAIETGELIGENDNPMGKYDLDEDTLFKDSNITLASFVIPLLALFATLIAMILWTGKAGENGIGGAFVNSNISLSITTGFLVASIAAGIMGAKAKIFKYADIVPMFCKGVALNSDIPIILVLAWSIGSLTGVMNLKGYLINIVAHYNIAAGLMPAFLFVVGAFVGFSTGSSWGVWAIIMPISLPIAHTFGVPMELMIGASLSGGVFGDHCSPISDTTILASTAAGSDHVEHVKTQLPYSLTVGTSSVIGFLVGGLISPILGLIVAAILIVTVLFMFSKIAEKRNGKILGGIQ